MIFREDDAQYLKVLDEVLANEVAEDPEDDEDDEMDDDSNDVDVDMASGAENELVITRKCDGILDIVLVGEVRSLPARFLVCRLRARSHPHHHSQTDLRHGQAWHHYRFYGRIREWDGLVALIRVPVSPCSVPRSCFEAKQERGTCTFISDFGPS